MSLRSLALFTTYKEALDYLFHFTDYERMHRVSKATSVFGLSRMNKLLDYLGNPHRALRAVHIAGTKGKGSTAAMAANICRAAGMRTGLYTSPHLVDIRERIQVNGEWIPETEIVRHMNRLLPYLERAERGGETYAPTFFEIFTVIAFLHFLDSKTEMSAIEVGLGGRLDATNVLEPVACAITPVSFDHTDKLGKELWQIAREKAGIIKQDVPVVSGVQAHEALEVIRAKCREKNSPLHELGGDIAVQRSAGGCTVRTWRGEYALNVPLLGWHQCENAAVAVGLAELMRERGTNIPADAISRGIAQLDWPGRIQTISARPEIIVDGAHNHASIDALLAALRELPPKKTIFVVAIARDKDIPQMLDMIARAGDEFIATNTRNPRAMPADELGKMLAERSHKQVTIAESPKKAFELARIADPDARICFTGSMYLAGDVLSLATARPVTI